MQDDEEDDEMDDDGDVYGVGGLLPLDSDREGVKGVKTFLLEQAGDVSLLMNALFGPKVARARPHRTLAEDESSKSITLSEQNNIISSLSIQKGPTRSKLEEIFSSGKVGFLLSERFVNIPPRIAVPLLKSINEDWKKVSIPLYGPASCRHTLTPWRSAIPPTLADTWSH